MERSEEVCRILWNGYQKDILLKFSVRHYDDLRAPSLYQVWIEEQFTSVSQVVLGENKSKDLCVQTMGLSGITQSVRITLAIFKLPSFCININYRVKLHGSIPENHTRQKS